MKHHIWHRFPDDLFPNVMAFLPFKTLLQFRSVSKRWYAIPLEQDFQKLRGILQREFLEHVQLCPKFQAGFQGNEVASSVDGFVLLVNSRHDVMHIVQPSRLSVQEVPTLHFCLETKRFSRKVVGLSTGPETQDFIIWVASGRAVSKFFTGYRLISMHKYDSRTEIWTWYGWVSGRYKAVMGVTYHHCKHLLLVKAESEGIQLDTVPRKDDVYEIKFYDENLCTWETLPGRLPHNGMPDVGKILLFDHNGRLFLAVVCDHQFLLWEYQDDEEKWIEDFWCPLTCFDDYVESSNSGEIVVNASLVGSHSAYQQLSGDHLYFGRAPNPSCNHLIKYNLVTGQIQRMSTDEIHKTLVILRRSGIPWTSLISFFLDPAWKPSCLHE